ncbi:MAG: hypothetical protein Q9213_001739 [Squamulea squamosa]
MSMRSPKTGSGKDPSDENVATLLMSFRSPKAAPVSVNTLGSATASASNDWPNRVLSAPQLFGLSEPERVDATLDDDTDAADPELDERTAEVRCRDGSSARVFASATSAVWGLARRRLAGGSHLPILSEDETEDETEALLSVDDDSEDGDGEDVDVDEEVDVDVDEDMDEDVGEDAGEEGVEEPEFPISTTANDRDDPGEITSSSTYSLLPAIPPTNSSDPDAHIDGILHIQRPKTFHTFINMMQNGNIIGGTMATIDGRKPKNKPGYSPDQLARLWGKVKTKTVRWVVPPKRPEFECELVKKLPKAEEAAAAAAKGGPSTTTAPSKNATSSKKKRKTAASTTTTATTVVPVGVYAPTANLPTETAEPSRKKRKVVSTTATASTTSNTVAGNKAKVKYPTPPDEAPMREDLKMLAGSGLRAQNRTEAVEGKGKGKEKEVGGGGKSTTMTTRSGRTSKKVDRLVEEVDMS